MIKAIARRILREDLAEMEGFVREANRLSDDAYEDGYDDALCSLDGERGALTAVGYARGYTDGKSIGRADGYTKGVESVEVNLDAARLAGWGAGYNDALELAAGDAELANAKDEGRAQGFDAGLIAGIDQTIGSVLHGLIRHFGLTQAALVMSAITETFEHSNGG